MIVFTRPYKGENHNKFSRLNIQINVYIWFVFKRIDLMARTVDEDIPLKCNS